MRNTPEEPAAVAGTRLTHVNLAADGENRNCSVHTDARRTGTAPGQRAEEPNAVKALIEIAAALDQEADKLEGDIVTKLPLNDC